MMGVCWHTVGGDFLVIFLFILKRLRKQSVTRDLL